MFVEVRLVPDVAQLFGSERMQLTYTNSLEGCNGSWNLGSCRTSLFLCSRQVWDPGGVVLSSRPHLGGSPYTMLIWDSEVRILVKRVLIRCCCEDDRRRMLQHHGRSDPLSAVPAFEMLRT